jgi:TATA-box binding protein (TBP) (component of TFIID and TFIIIB)
MIMVKGVVVNVVATASLGEEIDLYQLKKFKEIFHDPATYGGRVAYFKKNGMEGRVSIFPSGKMISIGTRSERQAIRELKLAMTFLVKKGFAKTVRLKPIVQNSVVTADFRTDIDLEKLSENAMVIYEPEQFPSAILRLNKPFKATILVFASGRVVVTGLKSSSQIRPTILELKSLIESLG